MKKTSKVFASAALSAALALGCAVPAFAEVGATGDTKFDQATDATDGSQSTVVNLEATTTQINATVPITVVVSAKIEGGTMITPSAGAYRIVNNSTAGTLYVTSAEGKLVEGEWSDAKELGDDVGTDSEAEKNSGDTARYGAVVVTLESGKLGEANADGVRELVDDDTNKNKPITLAGRSKTNIPAETPWTVGKATINEDKSIAGTELGLKLEARGSKLDDLTTASSAVKLMDIVYTVTMVNPNPPTTA